MADDVVLRVEVVDDTDSPGGGSGVAAPPRVGSFAGTAAGTAAAQAVGQQVGARVGGRGPGTMSEATAQAIYQSRYGTAAEVANRAAAAKYSVNPAAMAAGATTASRAGSVAAARGAVGGALASGAGAIGLTAGVALAGLAAAAVTATAAIVAFRKAVKFITPEAERAAQFNPQVAAAVAEGRVREFQGDIRRANRFGPEFASFIRERDELREDLREIKNIISGTMAPAVTLILDLLNNITDWIAQGLEENVQPAINSLMNALGLLLQEAARAVLPPAMMKKLDLAIARWLAKQEADADAEAFEAFFDFFDPAQAARRGGN